MYSEYRRRCRIGELLPGGVYLERSSTPWVLNLATQADLDGAEMSHVRSCLEWIVGNHHAEGLRSIAMPRIAAGLGSLDWEDVRTEIAALLGGISIPVFVYEHYVPGVRADEPGVESGMP